MTRREAEQFIESFVKLRGMATDEMSAQVPNLYPTWKKGVEYEVDERVIYEGVLYRAISKHTSQVGWEPNVAHGIFTKVLIPDNNKIYPWEQPESTNPYKTGDKVTYNGKTYESIIDSNVWAPDVYGWKEI